MGACALKEESRSEKRIYQPLVGMHPNERHRKWVGKQVTVIWQQPIFSLFGGGGKSGPLHELTQWFGYVVELDKQIPQSELLPVISKEIT